MITSEVEGHGAGEVTGRARSRGGRGRGAGEVAGRARSRGGRGRGAGEVAGRARSRGGRGRGVGEVADPGTADLRGRRRRGLVAGDAVDAFADQVGVAVVPRVLLDHVHVDPADVAPL